MAATVESRHLGFRYLPVEFSKKMTEINHEPKWIQFRSYDKESTNRYRKNAIKSYGLSKVRNPRQRHPTAQSQRKSNTRNYSQQLYISSMSLRKPATLSVNRFSRIDIV